MVYSTLQENTENPRKHMNANTDRFAKQINMDTSSNRM